MAQYESCDKHDSVILYNCQTWGDCPLCDAEKERDEAIKESEELSDQISELEKEKGEL